MGIKRDYICANGPWEGQTLFLTHSVRSATKTGLFEYKGERGRYVEDALDGKLYWEKHNDGKAPF